MRAMDDRATFDTYLTLLRDVVAARGGDPEQEASHYVWPQQESTQAAAPLAAVSLSPLLTGGGQTDGVPAAPLAPRAPAPTSGVVAVPPGISPPKG